MPLPFFSELQLLVPKRTAKRLVHVYALQPVNHGQPHHAPPRPTTRPPDSRSPCASYLGTEQPYSPLQSRTGGQPHPARPDPVPFFFVTYSKYGMDHPLITVSKKFKLRSYTDGLIRALGWVVEICTRVGVGLGRGIIMWEKNFKLWVVGWCFKGDIMVWLKKNFYGAAARLGCAHA